MSQVLLFLKATLILLFVLLTQLAQGQPDSLPELIPYRKGELWGFAAPHTRQLLIAPRYHEVKHFQEGLALVRLDKSWGLIDEKGKELTKVGYTRIGPYQDGLAIVQVGEKVESKKPEKGELFGAIDRSGREVIPVKYSYLAHNGPLFTAGIGYSDPVYYPRNKVWDVQPKQFVVLSRQGKELSRPYDLIEGFSEGMAAVNQGQKWGVNRYGFSEELEPGLWGYIDSTGREVVPVSLHSAKPFQEGRALVFRLHSGNGTVFIDKTGKDISDRSYGGGHGYSGGVAQLNRNGRWGLVDRNEKVVADFFYTEIKPFDSFGLAAVEMVEQSLAPNGQIDRKRGAINRNGEVVVPLRNWFLDPFQPNGFAKVWGREVVGRVNTRGKVVLDLEYSYITDTEHGFLVVNSQNQTAYFGQDGQELAPFGRYDAIGAEKQGRLQVLKGNKTGFLDRKGKEVITLQYTNNGTAISAKEAGFSAGLAVVCQNNQCGYIDTSGKVVIPLKYKTAGPFQGHWGQVTVAEAAGQKGGTYLVNRKGREVPLAENQTSAGSTGNLLRITEGH